VRFTLKTKAAAYTNNLLANREIHTNSNSNLKGNTLITSNLNKTISCWDVHCKCFDETQPSIRIHLPIYILAFPALTPSRAFHFIWKEIFFFILSLAKIVTQENWNKVWILSNIIGFYSNSTDTIIKKSHWLSQSLCSAPPRKLWRQSSASSWNSCIHQ